MRIALVSTPYVPVPPPRYGGTELIVAELAWALKRRGAEVIVYAPGDSRLPGIEVRSYLPAARWPPDEAVDATHAAWSMRDIARDPRGFDVVHIHSPAAVGLTSACPYPVLATLHHKCEGPYSKIYLANPAAHLVAISRSQARLERAPVWSVVHHGLSPERFVSYEDDGYLLYLGRYSREKGCHVAVEVAARAGLPLVMAGQPHENDYHRDKLVPLMEKYGVIEVGPVGGARKATLLAKARALLFPIDWDEPFGLVMIEALLSGVPVLALRRGSVPEVISDGITGLIADNPCELVAAARIAGRLFDRARIRAIAAQRWSADRMAEEYLQLYSRAAEGFTAADAG
jgi:glycosyltransferase involved in cell wall biosynthesis